MPNAVCQACGQIIHWRNQRGVRLSDWRCRMCGGRFRRLTYEECRACEHAAVQADPILGELRSRCSDVCLLVREREAANRQAPFRNAADTIAKLRVAVAETAAERDALKTRLAESEAGAAAMREALELFVALSDAAKRHNSSPHTVREFFRWDSVPFAMARAALSSDAGRETAERMRRLEAVAQAVDKWDRIRAELNGYTADVKAGRRSEEQQREDVKRLVAVLDEMSAAMAALRALEGGEAG